MNIISRALFCVFAATSAVCACAQGSNDSIRIHFRQGRTEIDTALRDNHHALRLAADLLAGDSLRNISSIKIIGSASPEGSVATNRRLSEQRALRLFGWLSREYGIPDSLRQIVCHGRYWEGLLRLTEASDPVPYKAEVISLLREIAGSGIDSEENLARLKRLRAGVPYAWLYRELFPELRGTSLYISYRPTPPAPVMPAPLSPGLTSIAITAAVAPTVITRQASGETLTSNPQAPFYMAVKTNLLHDALLVPDIGAEFYIGRNLSITGSWMYAWWTGDRRHNYWRTYGGDLGIRLWFGRKAKGKPLTGHHLGLYGQIFTYDFELGGRGYMGGKPGGTLWDKMNYAAGVEYGYSHPVAHRLNLDFSLGIGYQGGTYHEYLPIEGHYVWQKTRRRHWFGPTKAEISLVWLLGRGNFNREGGGR